MIELRDIHKSYGSGKNRREVLKGISLSFRENEFVSILGPSGSGKTTLLNVIGGLDHYDEGDLIIRNISTKGYSSHDWDSYRNHSVGFIFQSYNLIQHQSVLSNVEMALTISGVSGKKRRELAAKALERVGLAEHMHKKPSQLSGGQMQRVAIARALVNNPSVVLADEPTGALDSKTSVQVMELLREIAADRLVIMVTHNPELAAQYATRTITLKDGEILGDTDPYIPEAAADAPVSRGMGRSSMSPLTALSLSFHNLWTKRSRTLLTAFAGSIGIIGIALIIALSSGVNDYIARQEQNMAYQYPLLVETLNMDISTVLSSFSEQRETESGDGVEVLGFLERLFSTLETNDLETLKAYLDEDENDIDQYGTVEYVYNITPQIYVQYEGNVKRVCPDSTLDSMGIPVSSIDTSLISSSVSTNMFYCMPRDESLYIDRYDVKAGRWPEGAGECVLVLTAEGKVSDYLLYVMGLRDPATVDSYIDSFLHGEDVEPEELEGMVLPYEDFLDVTFKVVNVCDYYSYDAENGVWRDRSGESDYLESLVAGGDELKVVGVVQPKAEYGIGALEAGIDYPFALIEKTISYAKDSEIVRAQMDNPDVDVFTGVRFDESDENHELDPASLVKVDTDQLRKAIILHEDTIQSLFLSGANLEALNIDMPDVELGGMDIEDEVVEAIRSQLIQDLPGLISQVQIPSDVLCSMVQEILDDYMDYLEENGYLDIEVSDAVSLVYEYFSSDTFRDIVRNWVSSLDPENTDEGYLEAQIEVLNAAVQDSLAAYMANANVPQLPDLSAYFQGYLDTGRWEQIASSSLDAAIEASGIRQILQDYLDSTIMPLVNSKISGAEQELTDQLSGIGESISSQLQTALASSIQNGLSNTISHASECISLDMEAFESAFSLKLDMQELSDILLSLTNLSNVTQSGNLQKLGYVEMSHPKSIKIYPHDFDSKDAVIAVLDRYNQAMELEGKNSSIISYTDTLGAVMRTLSRIITIITSALIATVAVSLVVSSIMIGVITYISVLERRKEIGILRAMGASKHNISQIFNAETFITGLLSGSMGVGLAYLLIIPLTAALQHYAQITDLRIFLPVKYALMLVAISVVLTTIGGIIPAHNASKSDPVEALRTE